MHSLTRSNLFYAVIIIKPTDNCRLSLIDRAGNEACIIINIGQCNHNYIDGICSICGKNEYEDFTLTADNYYMAGIEREGDVVIPSTFEYDGQKYIITKIGNRAFRKCNITSVDIPNTVTIIEDWAFNECKNIVSVTIPESVTTIGEEAFSSCESLPSVKLSDNIINLGEGAFGGCYSLNDINIPKKLLEIPGYILVDCKSLSSITIPNNVISIGTNAFAYTGLTSITIPEGVTTIKQSAFYLCNSLVSVHISSSVKTIQRQAFGKCESLVISLPDTIDSIDEHAFDSIKHIYYNLEAYDGHDLGWGAKEIN